MSQPFFDINDTVVSQRDFAANGAPIDPSVVKVRYQDPSGNSSSWLVYGTDAQVEKAADGQYLIRLSIDEAGTWKVRWESSGTYASAIEDQFYVRTSSF